MDQNAAGAQTSRPLSLRSEPDRRGSPKPPSLGTQELAGKLHLTQLALGCPTLKELAARFSRANPHTAFTVQSAYKWLSGRATPRSSSVYADWSRVLDGRLTAPFVAASSFDEFEEALRRNFVVPDTAVAELRGALPAQARRVSQKSQTAREALADAVLPISTQPRGRPSPIAGCFLAVRRGWPGRKAADALEFSAIRIEPSPGGPLAVTHVSTIRGRHLLAEGLLVEDGRAAQAVLRCALTGALQFLSLGVPTFPGDIGAGIACGTAIDDPQAWPVAVRILLLRSIALDWNGLRDLAVSAAPHSLAALLAALGHGTASEAAVARMFGAFFEAAGLTGQLCLGEDFRHLIESADPTSI